DKLSNRVAACAVCNGEKGRYLHQNYKKMTTAQIFEAAKKYVQLKRSAWRKIYLEAIQEFKQSGAAKPRR
ncbi:MAG: hypothetical protein NTY53_11720, partial [Kiritimatiellaeota bacterium]|nr:hypothetical protein [Kiritimatiellota bacterium]